MGNVTQKGKAIRIAKAVTLCNVGTIYERVALKVLVRETLALHFQSHNKIILK